MIMLKFKILEKDGTEGTIEFEERYVINAGYTGRDQAAVKAHIDELKEEGIPAPDKTPVYFVKLPGKITQEKTFEVLDETDHSGEVEFVLLCDGESIYVGVGSDHTDRKLEVVDIPKAKQIYPNTISRELWRLEDVAGHWDDIIIRSWVINNGDKKVLQEAKLTAMLDPMDLLERVKRLLKNPDDTQGLVIYSGTVAALFKADYSLYFESELEDPVLGRKLNNVYELNCVSSWYKGD